MGKLEKPFVVIGIVNATPDSFYDGGRYATLEKVVEHASRLIDEGADILDIGGASSRPGAEIVPQDVELGRVVPAIQKIREKYSDIPISIDTTWVSVAKAAIDAGATIVNDISAGRFDNEMASLVASTGVRVMLMHSRKDPQTMQLEPAYHEVVSDVVREILESVKLFENAGVKRDAIWIDPGIGFAKNLDHNLALLHNIDALVKTGFPVVLGTSRKRFIGTITGRETDDRLYGSLGSIAHAFESGVKMFRVHDVAATVDFLKVMSAIQG